MTKQNEVSFRAALSEKALAQQEEDERMAGELREKIVALNKLLERMAKRGLKVELHEGEMLRLGDVTSRPAVSVQSISRVL